MQPATAPDNWLVTETFGSARDLHERPIPDRPEPEIWIHHVESPALVLGSSQSDGDLGASASGATPGHGQAGAAVRPEICRRRSGGGIVGLIPGNDLWIDVILPSSSRLWHDDVGVAGEWLGRTWRAALKSTLAEVTADETQPDETQPDETQPDETQPDKTQPIDVHSGPLLRRTPGRLICFAGLGPGEVTVAGHKVVGLSQRRTRRAARFQTVMTWSWPGQWLATMLADDALERAGFCRSELVSLPAGLPDQVLRSPRCPTVAGMTSSFLERLPEP